jgi:hypothetical protein
MDLRCLSCWCIHLMIYNYMRTSELRAQLKLKLRTAHSEAGLLAHQLAGDYRDGLMRTFGRKRSLASHGTSHDCKRPVVCAEALGLMYLLSSGLVLFASSRYRRRGFISVNQWTPMSTVRLINSGLPLQIF